MDKLPNRPKDRPWNLKTAPGTSAFTMHTDEKEGQRILVCTVGSTVLHYDARCVDDLHAMLRAAGDWVELGGADEQKPAKQGTVEAWGRDSANPIGGWYGQKKGSAGTLRGLSAAADGGVGALRTRTPGPQQSHARKLSICALRIKS